MPKARKAKSTVRHNPLYTDIKQSQERGYLRPNKSGKNDYNGEEELLTETPMTEKMSEGVLRLVHEQQEELKQEGSSQHKGDANSSRARQLRFLELNTVGNDDSDEEFGDEGNYPEEEDFQLSAEDEKALAMFMPSSASVPGSRNLADLIMDKIRESENQAGRSNEEIDADESIRSRLDPKVIEAYADVGVYLSHFTSGKIPKAFKIVPNLKNWEEIVYLTNPDKWSPQAMFAAVRLFAANLSPKAAQRFFNIILLPRVRLDIETKNRLNYHLYQSLIKTIFKPAAFFKGLLLPLAEDGCTPREAVIFSSILSRASIPVPHSAVALMKLARMEYSGPTLLFMKTLLNKKYSLPYKVVDALVEYFCQFTNDSRLMPIIWHQTLLVFVQRYKHSFKPPQKVPLNRLLTIQAHGAITNEIRRELNAQAALNSNQRQRVVQQQATLNRMNAF